MIYPVVYTPEMSPSGRELAERVSATGHYGRISATQDALECVNCGSIFTLSNGPPPGSYCVESPAPSRPS